MTPEGRVKAAVRKALESHGLLHLTDAQKGTAPNIEGFFFMPVAGPYSVHGIHDFVGCWRGVMFSIETKAPDNPQDATDPQERFQDALTRAGGISFTGVRDASHVARIRERIYERPAPPHWRTT